MHFTLNLDGLDHVPSVALQSAIKVVEVDATDAPCGPIVELRGDRLAERIVPLLLPPTHQVQTAFQKLFTHRGELFRVVLQIRVHGEHDRTSSRFEALLERRALAVVPGEPNAANRLGVGAMELVDDAPRTVLASVVHEDDLVREAFEGSVYARL